MHYSKDTLDQMSMLELTAVYNSLANKNVKKLKGLKQRAVHMILAIQPVPKKFEKTRAPSARAMLRQLFPSVGERKNADEVIAEIINVSGCKASTIAVTISDLKQPKLAGKAGVLAIERDGDFFTRVA